MILLARLWIGRDPCTESEGFEFGSGAGELSPVASDHSLLFGIFLSLSEPAIISEPGEGKAACANGETGEGVDSPMLNRLPQHVPGSGLYCANISKQGWI